MGLWGLRRKGTQRFKIQRFISHIHICTGTGWPPEALLDPGSFQQERLEGQHFTGNNQLIYCVPQWLGEEHEILVLP